jgi:pimeloyl-ACP methyl ester carboxylesterase
VPFELRVDELDASDWSHYLAREQAIFESVRANVSQRLGPDARVPYNRYFEQSPAYPRRFKQDWNRSYVMDPEGTPVGVVVLLHGLTDVRWEDWMAATRLAVRAARKRVPAPAPLHLVGFSNGGALAMKYSLDAIEDPALPRAERVVLFTPMIGITRFARFAGFAGLPAVLPPFANAAWLSNLPEFNPFKYNSFPVNGARQSYRHTDALPAQIQCLARGARLGPLLRPSAYVALDRLAPTSPQPHRFTAIMNAGDDTDATVERSIAPDPGSRSEFGLNLGVLDARGERGALIVDQDFLTRLPSNPFFPYLLARVEEGIDRPSGATGRNLVGTPSPNLPVRLEALLSTFLPDDADAQPFAGP